MKQAGRESFNRDLPAQALGKVGGNFGTHGWMGVAEDRRADTAHLHFPALDGLRGVAALTIVVFHSYVNGGFVPNARLGVDLFFIMSGFVIARSYGSRLTGQMTMTKSSFIARRFVRLYPMLILGALGGMLFALLHNKLSPGSAYPMHALLASGGLSLLGLPYLEPTIGNELYSFNPPMWSLFFEILANLVYVGTVRHLNVPNLLVIFVTGLAGVVWFGALGGATIDYFIPGFPRMMCGFFGGVLLHELWVKYPSLRFSVGFVPLTVMLLGLFCIPVRIDGLLFVPGFLLTAAIAWGAIGKGSVERRPVLKFLGDISYPIYLTHWLTLIVFIAVSTKLHLVGYWFDFGVAVHLCATPLIGYVVVNCYETPAREWLGRLLHAGQKANVIRTPVTFG